MLLKQKIDNDLRTELRRKMSLPVWFTDQKNRNEIVPEDQKHEFLLNNFKISPEILQYYYESARWILTREDKEYFKSLKRFAGTFPLELSPFFMKINGAFVSRADLDFKLQSFIGFKESLPDWVKEKDPSDSISNIKIFSDLEPYFIDYAKGFEDGYKSFEDNKIKPYLTLIPKQDDVIKKIFEFIITKTFDKADWFTLVSFGTDEKNTIVSAYEDGQKQGYFYRAWCIVFANNSLFAPLFKALNFKPTGEPKNEDKPKIKKTGLQYAVTYCLDCYANDTPLLNSQKGEFQTFIAKHYTKEKPSPNTVYKNFNDLQFKTLTKKDVLIDLLGEDWATIVLSLSKDKATLKAYLKEQRLIHSNKRA